MERTMKTATKLSSISRSLPCRTTSRLLTISTKRYADQKDHGPGKDHTVDKAEKGDSNIQSVESKKGKENRANDMGGHATQERDTSGSAKKAEKENPKTPKPIIGMQDERGGKGLQ